MVSLQIVHDTLLKETPNPSTLPDGSTNPLVGGTKKYKNGSTLEVEQITSSLFSGHYKVTLEKDFTWDKDDGCQSDIGYLYWEHTSWKPQSDLLNPEKLSITQKGIDLIKEFEGCELKAYQDAVGVWTIGYGHTKGVYPGMKISQAQADEMLIKELKEYEAAVRRKL